MEKPRLASAVQIVRRDNRYIFINPNIPRWLVTDALGEAVLSLFDGTMSLSQIVDVATEGLGEKMRPRLQRFCNVVASSGLVEEVSPQLRKHRMNISSVHLSLSDSCNLQCIYCYAKERVEGYFPKMTLDDYKVVIDDILSLSGNVTFTLTGGEPLLNPDCFKIAEYIKEKGGRVFLLSNGTLFSEANIDRIAELFDLVTLSIDGPNETIHSQTRGNNFSKVMHAVELMDSRNIDYTLSMTVTQKNIDYVEEMAQKFGGRLNFAPYFPIHGEVSDLAVTGIQYYQALKSAANVEPLSFCGDTLLNSLSNPCRKCAIGDGEFSISASGDVYPCQLLHVDEFYAGNIHERSIKEIYASSAVIERCSHLEVDNIEGCRDCAIKYICGGSCRARAYYEGGDIATASDFCKYEKEAFYDAIISIYSENLLDS